MRGRNTFVRHFFLVYVRATYDFSTCTISNVGAYKAPVRITLYKCVRTELERLSYFPVVHEALVLNSCLRYKEKKI